MDENFSVNLLISRSGKQKNRFESSLLSLLLKRDKPIFFVVLFHQILQNAAIFESALIIKYVTTLSTRLVPLHHQICLTFVILELYSAHLLPNPELFRCFPDFI